MLPIPPSTMTARPRISTLSRPMYGLMSDSASPNRMPAMPPSAEERTTVSRIILSTSRPMRLAARGFSATARLMGLEVDRMILLTVVLSSALGGIAGILFGLALSDISPYIGRDNVEIRGLAVIVLGGMGSIPGAVAGGYLLGLIEVMALVLFGSNVPTGVAFAALFLMLVLRPQGIFGAQLHERL